MGALSKVIRELFGGLFRYVLCGLYGGNIYASFQIFRTKHKEAKADLFACLA